MKYLILLMLTSVNANADNYHHVPRETITGISVSGQALSISMSQIDFDWATDKMQVGIGMGHYNGTDAISASFGKKWCNDCPLIKGSIGGTEGRIGGGLGAVWRF